MTPLDLTALAPGSPGWQIDWDRVEGAFGIREGLAACPQDPAYHAEGHVWTHTQSVGEALAEMPAYRGLDTASRAIVFAAAVLHDVGKPKTTRPGPDGRLTSRGHSARGEAIARVMLWRAGVPFAARESVCSLVRHHQVPFFLLESSDARRLAHRLSWVAHCGWLSLVAEADARGRECADATDQRRMIDSCTLFAEYCREEGCLDHPRPFPSDHSRFLYLRKPGRDPDFTAWDDTRCEVIVMSGLPAVGKDTWLRTHAGGLPVVSLDDLRREMRVHPDAEQGAVVAQARERARDHLRAGRAFAWNATNLGRDTRARLIDLLADYNARVRIVYVEEAEEVLRVRNAARDRPVPAKALDRMIDRWTIPTPPDAQTVEHWIAGTRVHWPVQRTLRRW